MFRLQNALKPVKLGDVSVMLPNQGADGKAKDWESIQKQHNYLKTLTFFNDYFTEQEEEAQYDANRTQENERIQ